MSSPPRKSEPTTPTPPSTGQVDHTRDPKGFLAYLRHELRTPVNAIIGYSEMLLEDVSEGELGEALQQFQSSGRRLIEMINELLAASRHGEKPLDLKALRAEVEQQLKPICDQIVTRCERLTKQLSGGAQESFVPDIMRIRAAGKNMLVIVQSAFETSPTEVSEAFSKSGSSLAPAQQQPQESGQMAAVPAASVPPGHVLVVDDNRYNRDILARNLYREGHSFALAQDGVQALDMIRSGQFDVVLLDVMMPNMNGFQVLETLKADPQLRDLPVIIISGLDEVDHAVRCIEMGAIDYLPKPFNPVLLRARVNASLERKRWRDRELEYLRHVSTVSGAAAAVENGSFQPESLAEVSQRPDELGQLARVFQHMAVEVYTREQRLKQEVQQLRVEIDQAKKAKQVAKITETGYFRQLQDKARDLRQRMGKPDPPESAG